MKLSDDFLVRLERLSIVARRISAGLPHGTHLSRRRGPSVEFREHRAYTPGDDPRTIDWNAAARLGQPFVKEFTAEEAVHVGILIDASASMNFGTPPKLETAQTLGAALAYIALAGLDLVTVCSFAEKLTELQPPARGKHAVVPLFRAIEKVQGGGRTDFRACFGSPVLPGRSILFVLTDFYDRAGYGDALRALRAHRVEVNLLHLVSPEETQPPPSGRVVLEDLETGERRRVTLTPRSLEAYQTALERYLESIETFALEHKLNYARLSSADPIEESIAAVLQSSRMLTRHK